MIDKKFKSDIAFGYAAQALSVLAGFGFMALTTAYGGLETYGALMILVSLTTILGNLVSFRTNEAVVAFYKRGETAANWMQCKFAVTAGLVIDFGVAALLYVTYFGLADLIALHLLKWNALASEVRSYGLVVVVAVLRITPFALLQSTERIKIANVLALFEQLAKVIVVLMLGSSTGHVDLQSAIHASLLAGAIVLVASYVFVSYELFVRLRGVVISVSRDVVREYASFTANVFASSTLKAGNQTIDTLVVAIVTDARTAGVYATLRQFLSPLTFLTSPFEVVSYPRFVKAISARRHHDVREAIDATNRKLLFVAVGFTVLVIPGVLCYWSLIGFSFGQSAAIAFALMALAALLRSQLWWARPLSNAVNPTLSLVANAGATVFLLIALYPATVFFGLVGTSLSMVLLAAILTWYWRRVLRRVGHSFH